VKGDATVPSISAASILAKTTRDALMRELDGRYPGFSLSGHKGYGTRAHVAALNALGPSPLHRRSFAPVRLGEYFEESELY
jgi:ribonuclease HII